MKKTNASKWMPLLFSIGLMLFTLSSIAQTSTSRWSQVGGRQFTGFASDAAIAHDTSGVTYIAYADVLNGNKVYVKKRNGNSWVNVGTKEIATQKGSLLTIAINPKTQQPWVAFNDSDKFLRVVKFDGTNWAEETSYSTTSRYKIQIKFKADGTATVATVNSAATSFVYTNQSGTWKTYSGISSIRGAINLVDVNTIYYAAYLGRRGRGVKIVKSTYSNNRWNINSQSLHYNLQSSAKLVLASSKNDNNYLLNSGDGHIYQMPRGSRTFSGYVKVSSKTHGHLANYKLNKNGLKYLFYLDDKKKVVLKRKDGATWRTLSESGIDLSSLSSNLFTKMAINPKTGNVEVAYSDAGKVSVKSYKPLPILEKVYVNENASGKGDGSSWRDAYTSLEEALSLGVSSTKTKEIWIAKGTYKPHATDRKATFNFNVTNLKVYGGFAGTETTLAQRDFITNKTILSGDLKGNDSATVGFSTAERNDNSYIVVTVRSNGVVLDGLTISDGQSNSSSYNSGAGIFKTDGVVNLVLKNCKLKDNVAISGGAGLYARFNKKNSTCALTIENCEFVNNSARYGSAVYCFPNNNEKLTIKVYGSLFAKNKSLDNGTSKGGSGSAGWFRGYGSGSATNIELVNNTYAGNEDKATNPDYTKPATVGISQLRGTVNAKVYNCIFWNNKGKNNVTSKAIDFLNKGLKVPNQVIISHNIDQEGFTNHTIKQNVSKADPKFNDEANGDYNLTAASSAAIDKGDKSKLPATITEDMSGNKRVKGTQIDIGAFELPTLKLLSLTPAKGDTQSSSNTPLELNFNTAITKGTGKIKIFTVADDKLFQEIDVASANVTISGSKASINHNAFALNKKYYVQVPAQAFSSPVGGAFVGITDKSWEFTPTKLLPTISNFEDQVGRVKGTLTLAASSNSGGAISYELLDVGTKATLSGRTLTFKEQGTVKVKAIVAKRGNYAQSSKTITITINEEIIFVRQGARGANNGTSWNNAYTSLATALSKARTANIKTIWVAKGTYKPHTSNRTVYFNFNSTGLKVYGGFAGNETDLSERDFIKNKTILSGDLRGNDASNLDFYTSQRNDNSYKVVYITAGGIELDGLTISNGQANGRRGYTDGAGIFKVESVKSLTLRNCTLKDNVSIGRAAALETIFYNNSTCSLVIENCQFINNLSKSMAAVYMHTKGRETANVKIHGCLFAKNKSLDVSSRSKGGSGSAGWFRAYGYRSVVNLSLVNNTYADNEDKGTDTRYNRPATVGISQYRGRMYASLDNCIFWNNKGRNNASISSVNILLNSQSSYATSSTTRNSIASDGFASIRNKSGISRSNPNLDSNYGLTATSVAAIDKGDKSKLPATITEDIKGNKRVKGTQIDIGAFELASLKLLSLTPVKGETKGALEEPLRLKFNLNVLKGNGKIKIFNLANNTLFQEIDAASSNVTVSGQEVSIAHTKFTLNGKYYVQVPATAIKDNSGDYFEGITDKSWSFTAFRPSATITNFNDITGNYNSRVTLAARTNSGGTISYQVLAGGTGKATLSGSVLSLTQVGTGKATSSGSVLNLTQAGTVKVRATSAKTATYSETSKEITVTINKLAQVITFEALRERSTFERSFTLSARGGGSNSRITYTSSNTAVATISGSRVTLKSKGETTITANQAGNVNYNAATAVAQRLVVNNKQPQTITFNPIQSKVFGAAPFTLAATGGASGNAVTFTSSNTKVATVSGNKVTIVGAGAVTITANQAGNATYSAASVSRILTVNKGTQAISFGRLSAKYYGNEPFKLTAKSNTNTPITYTSSNASIATISGNTVTIKGVGSVIIYANQAGTDNYHAARVRRQFLNVLKGNQVITFSPTNLDLSKGNSFELPQATSASKLFVSLSIVRGKDIAQLTYSSSAKKYTLTASKVGQVTIRAYQAGNRYYNRALLDRTITIVNSSKSNQTITFAQPENVVYGDTLKLGATSSSGLAVDYRLIAENLVARSLKDEIKDGQLIVRRTGRFTIEASQAGNDKFNSATTIRRTFTVGKAPLTITAVDKVIVKGDAIPTLEVEYKGFKLNETESVLNAKPAISTTATSSSLVGDYPIQVVGGVDDHYDLKRFNGKLSIKNVLGLEDATSLVVYPNPVQTSFAVIGTDVAKVAIHQEDGKLVRNVSNSSSVDVSDLASGLYLVYITHANGLVSVRKLMKK